MVQLPALPARLTHAEAQSYLAQCDAAWKASDSASAQLDASALHDFDSSAVAVLLELRRSALARQSVLEVHGLPARARELSTLYGVSELLPG